MAKKFQKAKETATPTEEATAPEKITQREAVKRALAAGKGSPAEGVVYVKEAFELELSNQAFSTIKSKIKSEEKPEAAPMPRTGKTANGGTGSGSPADLARTLKGLIATYGASEVSDMMAVLAD